MSVKNIVEKILEEAKLQESSILEEANKKATKIIEAKETEIASMLDNNKVKAKNEGNNKKERLIQNAHLQVRNNLLSAKQDIISKVFDEALIALNNMSENDFVEFFTTTISSIELKEPAYITLNSKMYGYVKNIDLAKYNTNLSFEEADDSVANGFIVKVNNVYYNYTFKSVLESLKSDLTSEVNKELF